MDAFEKKHCLVLGETLREMRLEAGLSQGFVSKVCGYKSAQFISNLERGLAWPPINVLAKMSELYNVSKPEIIDILLDLRKKIWSKQIGIKTNKR